MPRGYPNAKNNPVILNPTVETAEMPIEQAEPRLMRSAGPAEKALDEPKMVVTVDRPLDPEKTEMLAFMAEMVTVRVGTTADKNAEQVFEVNVNGRPYLFRRGIETTVPRYVVDRMARTKLGSITQKEVVNNEGDKDYLHVNQDVLRYDFAVTRDDNPRGKEWLQWTVLRG